MGDGRSIQMDDDERNEFLTPGGTGIISFGAGTDEPPYSVPVSYGYDATEGDFYLRLARGSEEGKAAVLDRPVSFVAYDHTEDGWRSVIATGTLEEVSDEDFDASVGEAMRRVQIPLVDVFDRHPRKTTFDFFRLTPDDVSGRKEAHTED